MFCSAKAPWRAQVIQRVFRKHQSLLFYPPLFKLVKKNKKLYTENIYSYCYQPYRKIYQRQADCWLRWITANPRATWQVLCVQCKMPWRKATCLACNVFVFIYINVLNVTNYSMCFIVIWAPLNVVFRLPVHAHRIRKCVDLEICYHGDSFITSGS